MTVVCVLQPSYLPWLGYFDQIARSDVFVFYDDVQFDKHGWRNRNRIKSANGIHWLTVPILHKGRGLQSIDSVEISNKSRWQDKHLRSIGQAYAGARYRDEVCALLRSCLMRDWTLLAELDIALVRAVCGYVGLDRDFVRSSTLGITGEPSERLLRICRHFGASRYISGNAAKDYLNLGLFAKEGIAVEWQDYVHPEYPQLHGSFESHLSVVDLLMSVGPKSMDVISRAG